MFLGADLAVLVLAQSKTAWVAALLGLLLVRWTWFRQRAFPGDPWRASAGLVVVACLMAAALAVVLGWSARQDAVIGFITDFNLLTLTGRTEIWQVTFDEFMRSPLIGYGPSIWDLPFRYEHRMLHVGQAHNQFIQTLGQAGLLGLGALLLHLSYVSRALLRNWIVMQGLGVVLLLVLLARCMAESPMRMGGIIGLDGWFQMLVFVSAGYAATKGRNAWLKAPSRCKPGSTDHRGTDQASAARTA
jgi:O-antigen ligase